MISNKPSGENPNNSSLLFPAPTIFFQLIAQITQKWRLNKNSVFPRRRSTNEWSGTAPQQPTPIRWLHPPIRILHNPRGGASSSIPLYEKLSDWSRALKGLRTLEMHVQGHVTYSKRESRRHFQTFDTRTPLIGQTPKINKKSVRFHNFYSHNTEYINTINNINNKSHNAVNRSSNNWTRLRKCARSIAHCIHSLDRSS